MTLNQVADILKIGTTSVVRFIQSGMLKRSMKFIDANNHICHEVSQDDIDAFLCVYEKVGTRYKVKKDIQCCLLHTASNKQTKINESENVTMNDSSNKQNENNERCHNMLHTKVAKILGLHPVSITRLINEGKLKPTGLKHPGHKNALFTQKDIDDFLSKYHRIEGRYIPIIQNGPSELPKINITQSGPKQDDKPASQNQEIKSNIDIHEILTWVVQHSPTNTPVGKCIEIRDSILKLFDNL